MNKKNSPYRVFEIEVDNQGKIEKSRVERITFQEAVRDAYKIAAISRYTKKIICVRDLT